MKTTIRVAKLNKYQKLIHINADNTISAGDADVAVREPMPAGSSTDAAYVINADEFVRACKLSKIVTVENGAINGIPFKDHYDDVASLPPAIQAGHEAIVPRDALAYIARAMAIKDLRYYLKGVFFDFKASAIVAIDGHRGHKTAVSHMDQAPAGGIVPNDAIKAALDLSKKAGSVRVIISDTHFSFPDLGVWGKCADGKFPDYERVFPASSARPYETTPMLDISDNLKKLAVFHRVVVIDWKTGAGTSGALTLPLFHPSVDVPTALQGVEIAYLADAIDAVSCSVRFAERIDSILITREDGSQAVVMPRRW